METYYCYCDPHGDNATCDRPCARSRERVRAEADAIVAAARQQRLDMERMMTEQSNAAAERSAHVERGPSRTIPGESFLIEVSPGVFQLKSLVLANQTIKELQEALLAAILIMETEGISAGDLRAVLKKSKDAKT